MAVRLSLAVLAVLAIAWLGVLLRDHQVGESASGRLDDRGLPRSGFAHEMRRLEDAQLLNPDSRWELARGRYWLGHGRPRRAADVLEALLRSEPDNLEGWALLAFARTRERRSAARARAEIERLNPLAARGR